VYRRQKQSIREKINIGKNMFDFFKWIGIYLGVGFFLNFVVALLYLKEFIQLSVSQILQKVSLGEITQKESDKEISIVLTRPKSVAFTFSILFAPMFFLVLIPTLFGKNPFWSKNS
jgi:hypothetical protein